MMLYLGQHGVIIVVYLENKVENVEIQQIVDFTVSRWIDSVWIFTRILPARHHMEYHRVFSETSIKHSIRQIFT